MLKYSGKFFLHPCNGVSVISRATLHEYLARKVSINDMYHIAFGTRFPDRANHCLTNGFTWLAENGEQHPVLLIIPMVPAVR